MTQLVVSHVWNKYEARKENMKKYFLKVKDLIQAFYSFDIQQISRMKNTQANTLSRLTTSAPLDLHAQSFFEVVEEPSIKEPTLILQLDSKPCWIDLLTCYLRDKTPRADRREA